MEFPRIEFDFDFHAGDERERKIGGAAPGLGYPRYRIVVGEGYGLQSLFFRVAHEFGRRKAAVRGGRMGVKVYHA